MPRKRVLGQMNETELLNELEKLPIKTNLRTLKVVVTDDDCRRSNPGHPLSCAVSTAVRRMLPKASYVCTKHHGLTVTIGGRYLHFAQTNKGSQTIRAFDEQKIKPPTTLTFQLFGVSLVRKPNDPDKRKQQINEARKKRRAQNRADKNYDLNPLRMRTAMSAKAEIRAAIARAKRGAEKKTASA